MLIDEYNLQHSKNREFLLTVVYPSALAEARKIVKNDQKRFTFFNLSSLHSDLDQFEQQITRLTREFKKEQEATNLQTGVKKCP